MNVSVVVPTLGLPSSVEKVLESLISQSYFPYEVIVVDSSLDDSVLSVCNDYRDRIKISYIKVSSMFPGEARNFGIKHCAGEIVAILDSKTIPIQSWLEINVNLLLSAKHDVCFGSTYYDAETAFQKILQACIYGTKPVETTPGSVLFKEKFLQVGNFIEGVRTGDDLEWRDRIRHMNISCYTHEQPTLLYNSISKDLSQELKRAFTYGLHSAKIDVKLRMKIIIFGVVIVLITLLIPQWNNFVGWESSNFYIPNITKSYFYFLSLFSAGILILYRQFSEPAKRVWLKIIMTAMFLLSSYLVLKWNAAMANWVEESIYYFPHITKIYLASLLLLGILYRGLYCPLTRGIHTSYLFPIRWLLVGIVGFIIDIAKIPGYFIGAILGLYRIIK